jgi:hypothetical protein
MEDKLNSIQKILMEYCQAPAMCGVTKINKTQSSSLQIAKYLTMKANLPTTTIRLISGK